MVGTYVFPALLCLAVLSLGCSPQQARTEPQMDVTRFLGMTRAEAIQVLGEPSQDMETDLVWQADKLPSRFTMLVLKFHEGPVCFTVNGHIRMPGDPERVLDAIGLGGLERECRRAQILNAEALQCIAPPYEAEIATPRHPGVSTDIKSFLVWRQGPGRRSLALEWSGQ